MTFESEYARMCSGTNQHFTDKAVEIAHEVLRRVERKQIDEGMGARVGFGMRRVRDAMADAAIMLMVAARDGSLLFYDTDLPVAILPDAYGEQWVDPVADAAGVLAATLARAATVLIGTSSSDFSDEYTGEWATTVLEDVRTAAKAVISKANR